VPAAFFLRLALLFAAGFLLEAAAPAFELLPVFFAAAVFAVASLLEASAVPVPAAIRTAAHSSRLKNAIARNLALFPNNLTPKATPTLQRPARLRIEPTLRL
jgi:hypothetical protein